MVAKTHAIRMNIQHQSIRTSIIPMKEPIPDCRSQETFMDRNHRSIASAVTGDTSNHVMHVQVARSIDMRPGSIRYEQKNELLPRGTTQTHKALSGSFPTADPRGSFRIPLKSSELIR